MCACVCDKRRQPRYIDLHSESFKPEYSELFILGFHVEASTGTIVIRLAYVEFGIHFPFYLPANINIQTPASNETHFRLFSLRITAKKQRLVSAITKRKCIPLISVKVHVRPWNRKSGRYKKMANRPKGQGKWGGQKMFGFQILNAKCGRK